MFVFPKPFFDMVTNTHAALWKKTFGFYFEIL